MNQISIEDFKQLLLDLYIAQRENAELHDRLAVLNADAPEGREDEGV